MERQFALTAIIVANAVGIFLVGILVACYPWRLRNRSRENHCIQIMLALIFTGCVLDPLAYYVDGMPGALPRFVNYFSNTLLYLLNMGMAIAWFVFLVEHMRFRLKFLHKAVLGGFLALGFFAMVINCFVPFAFDVDSSNVYSRRLGYFLYVFIDHGIVIDSLILYLVARSRGGLLRLFPVWAYAVPFVVGSIVQASIYGISILCTSYAISMAGLLSGLQGRLIYMDTQTGAYNKNYLDFIAKGFAGEKPERMACLLLNINGFRKINESLGRDIGDKVLASVVRLLNHAVGESGNVVRYSADEFVVLLNAKTEIAVSVCIARIKANVADYNKLRDCPAKITVRLAHRRLADGQALTHQMMNELEHEMQDASENG